MNAQDRARIDRDCEEVFVTKDEILSPGQQIRLHFRCLIREHKFGELRWHLKAFAGRFSSPILLTEITECR